MRMRKRATTCHHFPRLTNTHALFSLDAKGGPSPACSRPKWTDEDNAFTAEFFPGAVRGFKVRRANPARGSLV